MNINRDFFKLYVVGAVLIAAIVVANPFTSGSLDTRSHASEATWVEFRSSNLEGGDFSQWDQINTAEGTLTVIPDGSETPTGPSATNKFVAKAYQNGSGNTNGHYSRSIWNIPNWGEGQLVKFEGWFYLPSGTYNNMQGSLMLMGFDTYPVLHTQMRLSIYNGDKKARLFRATGGAVEEVTSAFNIPEGQWVKLSVEQKISQTAGWSKIYMNDQLVAEGSATNCTAADGAKDCQDTYVDYPLTRIRYGIIGINDPAQLKPLTVYYDDAKIFIGSENTTASPTPIASPTTAPSPVVNPSPVASPNPSPIVSNAAPQVITSSLPRASKGKTYTAEIKATDANMGDILQLTVTNKPTWLSLSGCTQIAGRRQEELTCRITGVAEGEATQSVTVLVSDNKGNSTTKTLQLTLR